MKITIEIPAYKQTVSWEQSSHATLDDTSIQETTSAFIGLLKTLGFVNPEQSILEYLEENE